MDISDRTTNWLSKLGEPRRQLIACLQATQPPLIWILISLSLLSIILLIISLSLVSLCVRTGQIIINRSINRISSIKSNPNRSLWWLTCAQAREMSSRLNQLHIHECSTHSEVSHHKHHYETNNNRTHWCNPIATHTCGLISRDWW